MALSTNPFVTIEEEIVIAAGPVRWHRAYEELNGEIRGIFLKDITAIAPGATASSIDEADRKNKLEM